MEFYTQVAGAQAARMIVAGGVYNASATGTDKGVNSTNFSAQYDDGTLLTCYPSEAKKIGSIDLAYWDSKVENSFFPAVIEKIVEQETVHDENGNVVIPAVVSFKEREPAYTVEKIHEPARKFAARLGTEYDPTTLAGQRKHLEDKKHLTPYPNPDTWSEDVRPSMGKWIQCGVEMDECLFLYICELEDRIKALEVH